MIELIPWHGTWSVSKSYRDKFASHVALDAAALLALSQEKGVEERGRVGYRILDGVAVVSVRGVLTKYPTAMTIAAKGTALIPIADAIRQAATEAVEAVVLRIEDCPGGEFAGRARVEDAIDFARERTRVFAHVTGNCRGLGYWLAMTAGPILAADGAIIGELVTSTDCGEWLFGQSDHVGDLLNESEIESERFNARLLHRLLLQEIIDARPGVDRRTLNAMSCGGVVSAEVALAAGVVDGNLPFEVLLDRIRRGPLDEERKCMVTRSADE